MSARSALPLVALLLAATLAGCLGGDAPGAVDATRADVPPEGVDEVANATGAAPLRFDADPVETTILLNGSFEPQEPCVPVGCFNHYIAGGPAPERALDISADVPMEAPTRVRLTLTYDEGFTGYMYAYVRAPNAQYYSGEYNMESQGQSTVYTADVTIARFTSDPVEAVVWASSADAAPANDFQLRVDITHAPEVTPFRVPVLVPLEGAGDGLHAEPVGEGEATLVVYGPEDDVVQRVPLQGATEVALPEGAPAGDYVLVATGSADGVRLTPLADPAEAHEPRGTGPAPAAGPEPLTPLQVEWTYGEPRAAEEGQTATWRFDAPAAPLAVGVYVSSEGAPVHHRGGVMGTVTTPAGEALSVSDDRSSTWLLTNTRATWLSPLATPALVTGAYEAQVTVDEAVGAHVGHVLLHYKR